MKKIFVAVTALMVFFSFCGCQKAAANDEAMSALYEQLYEKFPSLGALKEKYSADYYGDDVTWSEETMPSPHDADVELKITRMSHTGIEISVMTFNNEGEEMFIITSIRVEEAGSMDFLGIDKGSSRKDVIKAFGEPGRVDDEGLHYEDESGYNAVTFVLDDDDNVWRIRYSHYAD